jgi:serine/threonine protein kinase
VDRQSISHYEVLDKLGEGGMGVVYKARDTRLDRLVALKLLPPRLLDSAEARRRFAGEARAISTLDHPNIAAIYEVTEDRGAPVLVLEYLAGGTLRNRLCEGRLPLAEILNYAVQIADCLDYAHRHGILHRDVKSDNLMFDGEGRLKLTDFGLARFNDGSTVTLDGTIAGTLTHIAPECAQGLQPDHRADIFSLGIVLYEMAAGEPPFRGEHAAAVLYDVVHTATPSLRAVRADLPDGFQRMVRRATAKDRRRRYQSMGEFAADLRLLQKNREAAIAADEALTILVVEDEDDLRNGVEIRLSREGFRVLKAANGPEGVRLAGEEGPQLIVLDVMLPGMNGLEVCRELRRTGFGAPIIMLSAKSEETDRVVGLEAGADDYVTKPFSMRELLARVRVQLRHRCAAQGA